MKIVSWNVNSIRKGVIESLVEFCNTEEPDIICFQETKCTKVDGELYFLSVKDLTKKYPYRCWNDSQKGHFGVSVWSKIEPNEVSLQIKDMEYCQGRVILLEFDNFTLLNTYVPNTGTGEAAEVRRTLWHRGLINYLEKRMKDSKNFIWCGDLNVVREPSIDTSHKKIRIKDNSKSPGGMKIFEYEQFCEYLKLGLVDVFRYFHKDVKSFTWHSFFNNNVGWRLDYFITNNIDNVKEIVHYKKFDKGVSDHSPLYIVI